MELLPCPFCGKEASCMSYDYGECRPDIRYDVSCDTDNCRGSSHDFYYHSAEEAKEEWNKRTRPTLPGVMKVRDVHVSYKDGDKVEIISEPIYMDEVEFDLSIVLPFKLNGGIFKLKPELREIWRLEQCEK